MIIFDEPNFKECTKSTDVIKQMKKFCKKHKLRIITIKHYGQKSYPYLCIDIFVKNKSHKIEFFIKKRFCERDCEYQLISVETF